jgi:DNA polymerase (family 10)
MPRPASGGPAGLAQREQVRQLGARLAASDDNEPMVLLHGTGLNIAPDGTVDWPAEFLDGFDVCVASVHPHFDQSQSDMTRRFIAACENPHVNIIGHRPAGGRRPTWTCPSCCVPVPGPGTALEENAHPNRLDLPSAHMRAAKTPA